MRHPVRPAGSFTAEQAPITPNATNCRLPKLPAIALPEAEAPRTNTVSSGMSAERTRRGGHAEIAIEPLRLRQSASNRRGTRADRRGGPEKGVFPTARGRSAPNSAYASAPRAPSLRHPPQASSTHVANRRPAPSGSLQKDTRPDDRPHDPRGGVARPRPRISSGFGMQRWLQTEERVRIFDRKHK